MVPASDLLVLSALLEAGHSLPTAKLASLDLRMTTGAEYYGSVGFWQSVNQDEAGVGIDRGRLSSSCYLCVRHSRFLARLKVLMAA